MIQLQAEFRHSAGNITGGNADHALFKENAVEIGAGADKPAVAAPHGNTLSNEEAADIVAKDILTAEDALSIDLAVAAPHVRHIDSEAVVLLGQASGSVAGLLARQHHNTADAPGSKNDKNKAAKKGSADTAAFLTLLQIEIVRLQMQITALDEKLRDRYGDNYVEDLATEYLGEEFAKRREGETYEEYEQRIALELAKKIANGEISVDDPLVKDWAEAHSQLRDKELEQARDLNQKMERAAEDGEITAEEQRNAGMNDANLPTALGAEKLTDSVALKTEFAKKAVQEIDKGQAHSALAGKFSEFTENAADTTGSPQQPKPEAGPQPQPQTVFPS